MTTQASPSSATRPTPDHDARQKAALERCVAVGGTITAFVNDQLQKAAARLPQQQDDLMDYFYMPGSTSTGGAVTPPRQSAGNITAMSAQIGVEAIQGCLQRSLGRSVDFEAIARAIEAAGGPIEVQEVETGGFVTGRTKSKIGANKAVGVPRP